MTLPDSGDSRGTSLPSEAGVVDESRCDRAQKMKPLVYIAGPYTSPDPVLNVRRAVKMAERVAASGAVPIVPHLSMLWHLVSPQEIDYWYQYDLEILLHCHALIRLVGASPGADREVAFAEKEGTPVFIDGHAESFWVPFLTWQDQWRP